ncbi:MAG: hypothetical protein ACTHKL_21975 [Streptosporangiaceae bacterium]
MTGILALACFVTGFIVAWLLRAIVVMAQISRSQERMERRVRYWQGKATSAEERVYHLTLTGGHGSGPPDWPDGAS